MIAHSVINRLKPALQQVSRNVVGVHASACFLNRVPFPLFLNSGPAAADGSFSKILTSRFISSRFFEVPYSRSKDGGLTWRGEVPSFTERPNTDMNFLGKDFALRLWRQSCFTSANRGGEWHGPFELPAFEGYKAYARSNYIVTGRNSALLFLSTYPKEGAPSRSFLARLDGSSRQFKFVSWIGNDYLDRSRIVPQEDTYRHAIMPSGLRISDGRYVCAVRQRVAGDRWADLYETRDSGETWNFLSTIERGSDNPISLLSLGGDVVAAIYGWRSKPFGLQAKISRDAGQTWSAPIILRQDARNNDIGYTRAALRRDGTVVIAYYYSSDEHPEQHIAVTFWNPSVSPSSR